MTKSHNYPTDRAPTGPRPTAGRKRSPYTARVWSRVTEEQKVWVLSQGQMDEVIRGLIEKAMNEVKNV